MEDKSKFCPECGEPLKTNAKFCENCGNPVDEIKNKNIEEKTEQEPVSMDKEEPINKGNSEIKYHKNPILAAILSLIFILGQFYNGQILKGILFIVIYVILVRINLLLGILFLIYAAYDSYKNAKYINDNNGNYFYTSKSKEAL